MISGLLSHSYCDLSWQASKQSASAKDLGVILDPHLPYNDHVSEVVSSCFSKLCQINRVKASFDSLAQAFCTRCSLFNKQSGSPYKRPLQ